MRIERFEDILAWQKAKDLSVMIYRLFEHSKDFGFKDQIQRAAVSIMNNIAEGFGKIAEKDFELLFKSAEEISKMLSGFIKTL